MNGSTKEIRMSAASQIIVRTEGDLEWSAPEIAAYRQEAHLQAILADDPSHVPGVDSDAFTVCEMSIGGGRIDVCAVGRDGSITVVECKLESNSEHKRRVIGQVVDYASAIWDARVDGFLEAWITCGGADLRAELEHDAWERLEASISEARINLCLVVDQIDAHLRRLVEFLNLASHPDIAVTALQLGYASHAGVEILIPATFGGELARAKATTPKTLDWCKESFVDACATTADRAFVERLYELSNHSDNRMPVQYGKHTTGGVFFYPTRSKRAPFQLFRGNDGEILLRGNWQQYPSIHRHEGFAPIAEFLGQSIQEKYEDVPVVELDADATWAAATASASLLTS